MHTTLMDLLDIEYPVLLAPMGNVAGGALARAVTEAGGLGLLGAGYGDADWMACELERCRDTRFGIGFITWSLDRAPALLDQALERGPVAVMFSFGDCRAYIPQVHAADALVICQVQTVAGARDAVAAGADLIVAQGTEGGGHGATRGTFGLVPAVVDAVFPVPVVAAGGVADGRGLAASLMLGASGVLMGTRFYASDEALGLHAAKQALVDGKGDDTLRTGIFDIVRGYDWPGGYTGRAIQNQFSRIWHGHEPELRADLESQRLLYGQAVSREDVDTAVVFAGEALDLVQAIEPAGTLLRRTVSQAQALLSQAR